ncbi:MAG: periplasmic heavy metal sensor, partial [Dongia sp.]
KAARAKVEQAAEADPFDPAAFDQAFGELQTAMDGIQKVAHETISKILPQLPARQRHDLVEQWSKRWDRDRKE